MVVLGGSKVLGPMKSPNDGSDTDEQILSELKSLKTPLETIIMEGGVIATSQRPEAFILRT